MAFEKELAVAIYAARKGGGVIKGQFLQQTAIQSKVLTTGISDVVTKVDLRSSKVILGILGKHFPDDYLDCEEEQRGDKNAERAWIIDPLDGTRGYIKQIPCSTVSIALISNGEVSLGVIFHPFGNGLLITIKGDNEHVEPIERRALEGILPQKLHKSIKFPRVSCCVDITQSTIYLYHSQVPELALDPEQEANQYRWLREHRCWLVHMPTSAAFGMCAVALGRAEAFIGYGDLSIYDWAAGKLFVEQSGGKVWISPDGRNVVATNGKIKLPPSVFPGFPE